MPQKEQNFIIVLFSTTMAMHVWVGLAEEFAFAEKM